LQLTRWGCGSLITVPHLYVRHTPMYFDPPLGFTHQGYRWLEIFLYGPYGLLIISYMALWVRRLGGAACTDGSGGRYRHPYWDVWAVVGVAFFGPWWPSLVVDNLMIALDQAGPAFLIPWHMVMVGVECLLLRMGLRIVLGFSNRRAWLASGVAGFWFLALAGALMR
jgi:hypothetical protein